MNTNNEHINYGRLASYFDKELNAEEIQEVEAWVASSAENKSVFNELQKAHKLSSEYKQFDANSAWNNLNSRIKYASQKGDKIIPLAQAKKRSYKTMWIAAASFIILALIIGIQKPWISQQNEYAYSESNKQIELPDGSKIDLNEDAQLAYSENNWKDERQVQLAGEAFFSVERNEEKPFVISTKHTQITVLGTAFNVKSSNDDTMDEIVVKSGRVEVLALKSGNKKELTKGQKATIDKATGRLVFIEKAPDKDLFWKTKTIEFKNTELDSAVRIIEELYRISISIMDSQAGKQTVSTIFRDQSIQNVLKVLSITGCLEVKKTGEKTYQLIGEGCPQ